MKTTYKIELTEGCVAHSFQINGKEEMDFNEVEKEKFLDYLCLKLKEGIKNNEISLQRVVEVFQYDDYEHDDYQCSSCGDTTSKTIWNL